jgi:hypothetical protein
MAEVVLYLALRLVIGDAEKFVSKMLAKKLAELVNKAGKCSVSSQRCRL